jgi:SpoVK/Ycf46/Vps4 family AAA+-type ATPase
VQAGSAPPGPPPPSLHLEPADLEAALEGFTPAAFWGTGSGGAVQAGVEGWADVGGMEEARQALHEALELPTKYARLVAQVRGAGVWG